MASWHLNSLLIVKDESLDKNSRAVSPTRNPLTQSFVFVFVFKQASQAQADKPDYNMVDRLNKLRAGCLEAYTRIAKELMGD